MCILPLSYEHTTKEKEVQDIALTNWNVYTQNDIYQFALLTPLEGTWTHFGYATWNKDAFDKHTSTNQLQQQVKAKEEYEHYLFSAIASVNSTVLFTPLHLNVMRESLWSLQTLSTGQKGRCNRFNCSLVSVGRSGWHPGGVKHFSLLVGRAKCHASCYSMSSAASSLKLCWTVQCLSPPSAEPVSWWLLMTDKY